MLCAHWQVLLAHRAMALPGGFLCSGSGLHPELGLLVWRRRGEPWTGRMVRRSGLRTARNLPTTRPVLNVHWHRSDRLWLRWVDLRERVLGKRRWDKSCSASGL